MGSQILIVDDNPELVGLLAKLMQAEGWTTVSALKGREAISKLREMPEKPVAAVVDVLLPDMMGYDVAAELKKAHVPFFFITGVFKGGKAAVEAKNKHGAADFFEKPFEAKKLIDALKKLSPSLARGSPAPKPARNTDFDVEVAVEAEEAADALELTGKVVLTEDGKVSAVIQGERVTAPATKPPPIPLTHRSPSPAPAPASTSGLAPVGAPATEGALADNFPDLVTAFYQTQQTGELTVQKGKVKKTIYFEQGRPCFAISNLVTDRFGPFLARVGKITQPQLEVVVAAADKTGRRTGDILVEMKLLKDTEKLYYVGQQVKAIIYSLFGWEEGSYRIHFADKAASEAIKIDLHPANLIVRGIKKLYKPERLSRLMSPEDRLLPSAQPSYGLHEIELELWEAELLPKVDGTRTIAELIHIAGKPEHMVHGSLYAMVATRILEKR
jgi:DNA-binding response OmpR family regulator